MLVDIADGQLNMTNRQAKMKIYHHYGNLHRKVKAKKKLSGAGEILRAKKIACKLFGKVSQFI